MTVFLLVQHKTMARIIIHKKKEYLKSRVFQNQSCGVKQWQILGLTDIFHQENTEFFLFFCFFCCAFLFFFLLPRCLMHLVLLRNIPNHKTL